MSHPNTQGNGCSLEDCHTNLFALTDLDGIKWQKLSPREERHYYVEPLDDPVLSSFARCIQKDILCVWRRVQRAGDHSGSLEQLSCKKELWIFWYGERPATLQEQLSNELEELDQGCWENGLSYECRTLLFKALHNLIERCLLSQNFVRIEKWFVQPYDHNSNDHRDKSSHLSIQFSFFLHGESTVCASIDVREHPPLRRLHPQHLSMAVHHQPPVILAPYGLAGTLTGHSFHESDAMTQKLLQDWREFYIVQNSATSENLPLAVEVIVAGVRMRYPSAFILMTGEAETELVRMHGGLMAGATSTPGGATTMPLTPPQSPGCNALSGSDPPLNVLPQPGDLDVFLPVLDGEASGSLGQRLVEKVWHDCTVSSGVTSQGRHQHQQAQSQDGAGGTSATGSPAEDPSFVGNWEFGEPMQRNSCGCSRTRGGKQRSSASQNRSVGPGSSTSMGSKFIKTEKGDKSEKDKQRHSRNQVPFHRRSAHSARDEYLPQDIDLLYQQRIVPGQFNAGGSAGYKPNTPSQGASTPMPNNSFEGGAVDSPSSAPSPLVATPINTSLNQNGDPTMPTLSPHPPPKTADKELVAVLNAPTGDAGQPSGGQEGGGEQGRTSEGVAGGSDPLAKLPLGSKAEGAQLNGPHLTNGTLDGINGAKPDGLNHWTAAQAPHKHLDPLALKRPVLPKNGYEEEGPELVTESLYDFNSFNAWLEHPVKKLRVDDPHGLSSHGSHGHLVGGNRDSASSPQTTARDIYEFSDDNSADTGSFVMTPSVQKRSNRRSDSFTRPSSFSNKDEDIRRSSEGGGFGIKEEYKQPSSIDLSPATPGSSATPAAGVQTNWTREEDLKATIADLENIFDSDSESNEAFTNHNSPAVSGHMLEDHRGAVLKGSMPSITNSSAPTAKELSVMYPTPPSHENPQGAHSPVTGPDVIPEQTAVDLHTMTKVTKVVPARMTAEESIKSKHDLSFVYKPPLVATFLSSTKYSPIELPSNRLEPVKYHPHLVYHPQPLQTQHWGHHGAVQVVDKHGHHGQHHHHHHQQHHHSHQQQGTPYNIPSVETPGGHHRGPDRMTSVEASPAQFPAPGSAQQRTPRTPMSYELQSPASNASSYMNQNLKSVDVHTNSQLPEAHSLVVNIMLADSIMNLFKDHNFDSCTICVCNLNIKGADVGIYLPDKTNEEQYKCSCGFSAVTNRKYGANSGLFYEDEVDITGIRNERLEHRKPSLLAAEYAHKDSGGKELAPGVPAPGDVVPMTLLTLLQKQFSALYPSCTVFQYYSKRHALIGGRVHDPISILEIQDGCEACYGALEIGRQCADSNCSSNMSKLDDVMLKSTCLHKWPYLQTAAKVPTNSQDVVRLLKSLQPLLQDAIQKKRTLAWESVYTITGPLSWKDFHLLAGRGSDETSAPQPVPPLLAGMEKDWITLSPYVLRFWDKLMLEPYGKPRDVAYVILSPENDHILQQTQHFFKELSTMYEICRLGRHRPLTKKLRDGIIGIGKKVAMKYADDKVDDWFTQIGNSAVAKKLKLYAQICHYRLGPFLSQEQVDKSIFTDPIHKGGSPSRSMPVPSPSSHPSDSQGGGSSMSQPSSEEKAESQEQSQYHPHGNPKDVLQELANDDSGEHPAIVIYIIDPFTYGPEWEDHERLAMLGLLRAYSEMLRPRFLPERVRQNMSLQIIPLQAILDFQEAPSSQTMKNLAMSVYTETKRQLCHNILGRSLTGFGPAAAATRLLKAEEESQEPGRPKQPTPLYSSPFLLAEQRKRLDKSEDPLGDKTPHQQTDVLFCAYCLSEDQRWLLAVCTDNCGNIMETCTINIEIPNRNRRKKASARKIGLRKLWDFILGVMSMVSHPWRVVIGRFGRIGHGELKGWAALLSRTNLQASTKKLREMCNMCNQLSNNDVPCILSASLVSMELHQFIQILTDSIKFEDRSSSRCQLSTPRDTSCSHILVFPTSSTAQAQQIINQQNQQNPMDVEEDALFDLGPLDDIGGDLPGVGNSLAEWFFATPTDNMDMEPTGGAMNPGSPEQGMTIQQSPGAHGGMGKMAPTDSNTDPQESAEIKLLQQPLAMGFYVSTAKTGPLPKWFWSACPGREEHCPTCFKAALHIHCAHVQQNQDDLMQQSNQKYNHPLDSSLTCDVLRYVLETYNSLSWLTIDPTTNDRRSCLPAHFVVLMQLYHAFHAFV